MKILKYCAIFIGSLLVLLALTASPWGTRGVLLLADSSLDELDIDYGSGSLLSQLNRVAYVTPDMSLKVGKLAVDVNWSCVATMQACLSALSAQSVAVQLSSSEEQSAPSNEPLERITLPIPVSVDALDIRNIRVDVANTLEMKINSVSSELSMFRTLNIEHLTLIGTRIILPNEPTEAPDKDGSGLDIQAIANWHYTPIKLAPIVFPIVMRANNVAVDDLLISQGKEPVFDISALRAAIDITPKLLTVKKLQVSSSLGEAELTASVNKQWRHQLKMQLKSAQDSTYPIDAQLNLKGNLQRSELNLTTSGVLDLAANASVDLQSAQLPLSLEVNWQPVDWPPEQANIQLEKGQLSVSGNLNQYQLALDTALKGQSVPHTLVAMRAEGNNRQANIKHITLDTLGGRFQATAKVTIDTLLKWQSHIEFNNIQPQQFWPELEANIEGNVDIDGQYDGQIVRAHMRELSASGDWLDYQLSASGEAKFNSQEGIEVPELLVKTGDNQVTMTGTLEAFELNAQIDGTLTAPEINFDGSADKLTLPDMRISQLATKGQVIWDEDKQAKVELQLSNAMIAQQNIANLNVALNGDAQEHQISLSLNSDVANVVTKLHGSLAQSQWDGVLDVATIALDAGQFSLEQQEPSIHANWAKNEYRLSPFCLSDDEASVCIKQAEYLASTAQFDIAINELPLSPVLSANLPQLQGVDTDAKLNLLAKGQWNTKELPIVEADISLTPSVWTVEGAATPLELDALNVKVNTITQKNTSSQRITSKLTLESKQLGAIRSDVSLQVNGDEKPISGQLTLDTITLGAAAQFVPQLTELAGIVDGTVDISGSLTTPLIKGEVKLHDGAVAGSMLPSRVNQVEQRINFTGQAATLTGSFQLGNGKGQVDGEFDWQDAPSAVVNVKGSEMEIDYQNMVRAKLSPDVNVEFGAAGLSVKGEVTLPYARIRVRELPPSAISPSSDVVLVNDQQAVVEDKMPLKLSLQVNIDPKKNNDVKVDAFGLTSDLQGSLLLTQDGEVLNANGELNLVNGRYKAYGQDLVIREGEIQFSGPIDSPYLVVEAVRDPDKTADDVIAGLRIQGSASQPQVSVFSDPSMDQPEALSYLLRGTAINSEDETSSDAALASALIGFGLGKSENKVTNIGRKIGVEDLALNTSGAGDETKLSVSGYIAPGVQIRYGVGVFDSVSEVALRYQLIPKLYLEAVSSLNSELNLYYQFSLDDEEDTKPE